MNALARDPELDGAQLLARLDEIERALKFDPNPQYRRELIREYLALSEPENRNDRRI